MASLRTGSHGKYYGSEDGTSEALTTSEMEVNAKYIYSYLTANSWTLNAIAGMLGNMQAESSINPGRWQSDDIGNFSMGYGLVQWTPSTKYTDWCKLSGWTDPSEMDVNLLRIIYEVDNNIQWIATDTYNMSFEDFKTSSEPVGTLAKAFLLCYERPADQSESVQEFRSSLASNWYTFLSGVTPNTPTTKPKKKKKYNFLLMTSNKRRLTWKSKNLSRR